jgi:chromosome segregation ATPase
VPTKEELQDEVDELRLELERTRDVAESEFADLREEVLALRGELAASESRRRQLQSELATLNEVSNNLRELYREKEERLLAGVKDASDEVAAAYERWQAVEAQLRAELSARDHTILELQRKQADQQKLLERQNIWMVDKNGRLKEAEDTLSKQAQTIRVQAAQIERHGRDMREVIERRESILLWLFEQILTSPKFWVVILFLTGIAAFLTYVINSILDWLKPAPSLLGR